MKQKFTQAKKANRCSAFNNRGHYGEPSKKRQEKRIMMQPKESPIFGRPFKYLQLIGRKRIYHAYFRTRIA